MTQIAKSKLSDAADAAHAARQLQRLAALTNRPTRYELAAQRGDDATTRVFMAFSRRRTRQSVYENVMGRAELVVKALGTTYTPAKHARNGGVLSGGPDGDWTVFWTGRTECEAIIDGELPSLESVVNNRSMAALGVFTKALQGSGLGGGG